MCGVPQRGLRCRIFDLDLPGTLAFDFPTATALTAVITSKLGNVQQLTGGPQPSAPLATEWCA